MRRHGRREAQHADEAVEAARPEPGGPVLAPERVASPSPRGEPACRTSREGPCGLASRGLRTIAQEARAGPGASGQRSGQAQALFGRRPCGGRAHPPRSPPARSRRPRSRPARPAAPRRPPRRPRAAVPGAARARRASAGRAWAARRPCSAGRGPAPIGGAAAEGRSAKRKTSRIVAGSTAAVATRLRARRRARRGRAATAGDAASRRVTSTRLAIASASSSSAPRR